MIEELLVCKSEGFDPYENLALEEALLHYVEKGALILYLWQNARTVVIGKNQNPWKECRTALLAEEGGHLARRLSGGGAVFHDLGNLNFTFLTSAEDQDLSRQLGVLAQACLGLGLPVERSGRNDLLADGRKFSGNAFYSHGGKAYHHGTLMVDVDLDLVQRYLSPSRAKLEAKGVGSVRSRVVNLNTLVPGLTVARLSEALISGLSAVYGRESAPLDPGEVPFASLVEKYRSEAWLYGRRLPFTVSLEDRFSWGGVEIRLDVNEGVIRTVQVYTDSMDETLAPRLEAGLVNCPFSPAPLEARLKELSLPEKQTAVLLSLLKEPL